MPGGLIMQKTCVLERGQRILFDGDSITNRRSPPAFSRWPFLHFMNWQDTYADVVSQWLFALRPDLDLKFTNAAVGGSSTRELLARFDAFVAPIKPDWVIMTIGGNDQTRRIPLAEFRANLEVYAARLRRLCRGRLAVVQGLPACPGCPTLKRRRMAARRQYFQAAGRVARRTGGVAIVPGPAVLRKSLALHKQCELHTIYSDNGHLNALGNMLVAMEVIRGLGPVVEQGYGMAEVLAPLARIRVTDPDQQEQVMNIVVVGGGPTGVELAGSIADMKSFVFTIQTVGRIMRMPELKHYENEVLNKGYVFTNLPKVEIAQDIAKEYITVYESRRSNIYTNVDLPSIYLKRQRERTRLSGEFRKIFVNIAKRELVKPRINYTALLPNTTGSC